ncbi:MAG TPA: response regulator transcription factor [Solirubrobacteraceae bacterium]|nr:response regulator transcription factor [Solirubrobacteraceae bacterium]
MSGEPLIDHADRGPTSAERVVRVFVADDHPAMRGALARLVREHEALELVGEAGDGEQALEMLAALAPDVAVLDVRMPGSDGLSIVSQLRAAGSPVRVLLFSGNDESEVAHEAIAQGAAGFLSKDAEEAEIGDAIIAVAEGRSVLSPALQSGLLDLIRTRARGTVELSRRERELLELAATGLNTGEIAGRLYLSPNTVKTYWQRLYEKLGATDRASAMAEAIRRGLLT